MTSFKEMSLLNSAVILSLFTTACSLNSAWDEDQLNKAACLSKQSVTTEEERCLEGYSCLINTCVADYSVQANTTCLYHYQCAKGLVCPSSKFSCRKECSNYYQSDPNCSEANVYCAPVYESDSKVFENIGACLDAECTVKNADYQANSSTKQVKCTSPGEDCVLFKANVGKCFKTCTYDLVGGQFHSQEIEQANLTCHPVGVTQNNQTMVEWTAGDKQVGEKCDPLSAPCARGLVCVSGLGESLRCHKLCDFDEDGHQRGCAGEFDCIDGYSYKYCKLDSGDSDNSEQSNQDTTPDQDNTDDASTDGNSTTPDPTDGSTENT